MNDLPFGFTAIVALGAAPVLSLHWVLRRRELREARVYAWLSEELIGARWRGLFAVTARCSAFRRRGDLTVIASLPSPCDVCDFIAELRSAMPTIVRVRLDLVTPRDGRLLVTFHGPRHLARPRAYR